MKQWHAGPNALDGAVGAPPAADPSPEPAPALAGLVPHAQPMPAASITGAAASVDGAVRRWLDGDEVLMLGVRCSMVAEDAAAVRTVAVDTDYARAVDALRRIRASKLGAIDFFEKVRAPLHAAWKAITDRRARVLEPLEEHEERLQLAAGAWADAADESSARAAAQRETEQLEADRAKREADADRAAAAGRVGESERLRSEPRALVGAHPAEDGEGRPKDKGTAKRGRWAAEIVDLRAMARHALDNPDTHAPEVALLGIKELPGKPGVFSSPHFNRLARDMRGTMSIPGVRVRKGSKIIVTGD